MKLKQILKEIKILNPRVVLDLKPLLGGYYNTSEVETWEAAKNSLTEGPLGHIFLVNTFPQDVKGLSMFYLSYKPDSRETFLWGGIDSRESKNIIDKLGFNDLIWLNNNNEFWDFRIRLKTNTDKITYNGEPINSLP